MKKRMEVENVALLKRIMEMELLRLREKNNIDMVFFYGIDGRLFSSSIPDDLDMKQYILLNSLKENMPYLCAQLRTKNLNISIQEYAEGAIILCGVGRNAFLANIVARDIKVEEFNTYLEPIINTSTVIKHLFELKPMKEDSLSNYPPEVAEELRSLSHQLFKEKFKQTKDYKKNEDILELLKKRLKEVIGPGNINEIITMTFNEMGVNIGHMNRANWEIFINTIVDNHVKNMAGEVVAEECKRSWNMQVEKRLKSFI